MQNKTKKRKLKSYRSASDSDVSTLALARDEMNAFDYNKVRGSIHLRLFGCNSLDTRCLNIIMACKAFSINMALYQNIVLIVFDSSPDCKRR